MEGWNSRMKIIEEFFVVVILVLMEGWNSDILKRVG